jgi:hypothetical protein
MRPGADIARRQRDQLTLFGELVEPATTRDLVAAGCRMKARRS